MVTYQCINCDRFETLTTMVPDCCSACGSTMVSDRPAPDLAKLEALSFEAAEKAYADEVLQDATVVEALGMWSGWHADVPPTAATNESGADLRLADAFRMLIYLAEPLRQLQFIERELRPHVTVNFPYATTSYQAVLMRWWLQIFEHQYSQRRPAAASS